MKLQPDKIIDVTVISGYGAGYVDANGARHTTSLLLLPEQDPCAWPVASIDELAPEHLQAAADAQVELVIIGTGTRQRFVHPRALAALYAARIGVELMDTQAACRTYNILVGEGRKVAAALVIEST
jgi:uncharacterized protein